jgi:hypothetical protein
MSIYELEIGWAETADERRYLHWELLACDEVRGVFLTARADVLAVLFRGDRDRFRAWARSLALPLGRAATRHPRRHRAATALTNPKGALQ